MEPAAFVAGNQAQSDAAATLQVSDDAAINAADGLKISIERTDFDAQSAGPFGNELDAHRPAHHLVFTLTEAEEIVEADQLRPVHRCE